MLDLEVNRHQCNERKILAKIYVRVSEPSQISSLAPHVISAAHHLRPIKYIPILHKAYME